MRFIGVAVVAVVLAFGVAALSPAIASDDTADKVVVTRPGVVFHKIGSDDIRGHAIEKSIDAALEAGYTPCRVCYGAELGGLQFAGLSDAAGGAEAAFATTEGGIPAPPSSTVSQPFGLRAAYKIRSSKPEALQNPYDDLNTIRDPGAEQGAFDTH